MSNIDKIDQAYVEAHDAQDGLVDQVRASLERKRERHGDKFEQAKALPDLFNKVQGLPREVRTAVLAAALQRLATENEPDPFADIADLDFDPEEGPGE